MTSSNSSSMSKQAAEALAQARRFSRALQDRTATRTLRFSAGTALFNDLFPKSWSHNFLRVDAPAEGISAQALAAQAEVLHGEAGHTHRRLWVDDAATGEQFLDGLASLGWQTTCEWVMAHLGEVPLPDPRVTVQEFSHEGMRPFWEEMFRRMEFVQDEKTVQQLTERNLHLGQQSSVRHFGAVFEGRIVSACDLYPGEGMAEIQDVETLEEFRKKGFSRSVLLTALRAARERGAAFTFLTTDADDWPKEFYGRLGFQAVGRFFVFVRTPSRPE
ncbi:GNAT family N-acetyltransferase [Stigmatella sp. ncwal1]|uniref:GNAT family N-acetyltransferase n=1 Tax=Stigmatella ashevillensis TaxID=2995309 RepID=A0ABT5D7E2_9BACT|nr:GNAT family N-acetyltransferase [Stigmatella ashevillena]MDC0708182.1 GNAT family N-acetyltransferase [Stigmatella ashevillena]